MTSIPREATSRRPAPAAPIGPRDSSQTPRFAGLPTFALLPPLNQVPHADIAVVGVPFDAGTSFRPGARFGPEHIRSASRLLRPYNQALDVSPFAALQVADGGDIACNPFDIQTALKQIEDGAGSLFDRADKIVALGGDHTIALGLLRAVHRRHGPVALVHFDAHLDTWDTYFDVPHTHGTVFRRAAEEGLLDTAGSAHVGIRGPVYSQTDLGQDRELGFVTVCCDEVAEQGVAATVARLRRRIGDRPLYVSVDIDVLDPAHAPGTGTPEAAGLTSRELLGLLRGLAGHNLVSADIVEVSPAYDHAGITATAAAAVAYELISVTSLSG